MEAQIKKMKVSELKKELTKAGLGTTGEDISKLLSHLRCSNFRQE